MHVLWCVHMDQVSHRAIQTPECLNRLYSSEPLPSLGFVALCKVSYRFSVSALWVL